MEAMFDACKISIAEITKSCINSEIYAEECLKMAKYVAKCSLVLSEIELAMHADESLRGDQGLFRGLDCMVGVLKQVAHLVAQYGAAQEGGVWPLEDAVEFQAAALELQLALAGLGKLSCQIPEDVQQDLKYFVRQLEGLQFTTSELTETEELLESGRPQSPRAGANVGCSTALPLQPSPPGCIRVQSTTATAAEGAREGQGEGQQPSSPLPLDPFGMDGRVRSGTVRELENLRLSKPRSQKGEEDEGVGEEAALDARADNQDVLRRQQGSAAGLRGLRDLARAGGGAEAAGGGEQVEGVLRSIQEGEGGQEEERQSWCKKQAYKEGDVKMGAGMTALENEVTSLTEEVACKAGGGQA